jgi:hypothetical protein
MGMDLDSDIGPGSHFVANLSGYGLRRHRIRDWEAA